MSSRIRFVCVIILILLTSAAFSQTELKPRITVFPLENPSSDLQIDIISKNVKTTIELNLDMIGKYIVEHTDIIDYSTDIEWLSEYCETNSFDNILYGKAVIDQTTGEIFLEMSVFSLSDRAVTLTQTEAADTIFDIFDASDALSLKTMEAFSGMRLGFGTLKFVNRGDKGAYTVFIDDVSAGDTIEIIPRVLNGERKITITQERMQGPLVLFDSTVFITEKKTFDIEFEIPGFLEVESELIAKPEEYILKKWDNKFAVKKVDKNFETLFSLLDVYDYSATAAAKRTEIEEMLSEWERKKQEWGDTGGFAILERKAGAAVFAGANLMYAGLSEDGAPGWEPNLTLNPRAGLSLSYNVVGSFALQSEVIFNRILAEAENSNILITKGLEYDLLEFPLLLIYRTQARVVNFYAGINAQIRISDVKPYVEQDGEKEYLDDFDQDLYELGGGSVLAGFLLEIPVKKHFYMIDLRYSRSLNNWSNQDGQKIYPDNFAATIGYGIKFF